MRTPILNFPSCLYSILKCLILSGAFIDTEKSPDCKNQRNIIRLISAPAATKWPAKYRAFVVKFLHFCLFTHSLPHFWKLTIFTHFFGFSSHIHLRLCKISSVNNILVCIFFPIIFCSTFFMYIDWQHHKYSYNGMTNYANLQSCRLGTSYQLIATYVYIIDWTLVMHVVQVREQNGYCQWHYQLKKVKKGGTNC